jgi:hypothetical protein
VRITRDFVAQLAAAHLWDGTPIPRGLHHRLTATWAQLQHVEEQLHTLQTERTTHEQELPAPVARAVAQLQTLRAIGNAHVRRVIVQVAWGWIHYQPTSALSAWYQRRFGGAGRRLRKIGIVALARKLLIALWRYVDVGTLPDGAQRKIVVV